MLAGLAQGCRSGGSPTATVVAVDTGTGRQLWRSTVPGAEISGRPDVRDGLLHMNGRTGCRSTDLFHFKPGTGERVLPDSVGLALFTKPATAGPLELRVEAQPLPPPDPTKGTVALPSFRVTAVDPSAGAVRWTAPVDGSFLPTLAAQDGVVVVFEESRQALRMRVLAADDGRVLWRITTEDGYPARQFSSNSLEEEPPVVAGGNVYVFGPSGLEARDEQSGAVRWKAAGDPPAAVGGDLVVARHGSDLVAHDHSGHQRWKAPVLRGIDTAHLSVIDGVVYVAGGTGSLHCRPSD